MIQYPLYDVPRYDSFPAYLRGIGEAFADRPAVTTFTRRREAVTHTYRQLADDAHAIAAALAARGLGGAHTAIVGENSYEWLAAYLAVTGGGGVAVCVDAEQSDETIRAMLARADAEAVFASEALREICEPLAASGAIRALLTLEALPALIGEGRAALAAGGPGLDGAISPDRTAMIVYTSGTTSTAKPVMLSHRAILWNASGSIAMAEPRETVFTALPLYHTYALTCAVLNTLSVGAHVHLNGDLKTMLPDLLASGARMVGAVPLVVEFLHQRILLEADRRGVREEVRRLLRPRLKEKLGFSPDLRLLEELRASAIGGCDFMICGGAHLDREIAEDMRRFGVLILEGYGITECAPLVSVNRNETCVPGTVGQVLPDWELKLSPDGEILVRGPSLMQGYYRDETLTAAAMEDGWFKTGDLGTLDENGYLTITGRCKNLIVFKNGKKLSPEKVEELLGRIPFVREVVVYGAPGGASTDDVKLAASVYPDPEATRGMTSYEILEELQKAVDALNRGLPTYQQIQMLSIREQAFDRTSAKKIRRQTI